MLTRLIYASTATLPVEPKMISSILASARSFNLDCGITGLLCEGNGKFLQYIEGDAAHIDALYSKIQKDGRHTHLKTLERSETQARAYDDWSMGFVSTRSANVQSLAQKATGAPTFDPHDLSAKQALDLIDMFKMHLYPQVTMLPDAL